MDKIKFPVDSTKDTAGPSLEVTDVDQLKQRLLIADLEDQRTGIDEEVQPLLLARIRNVAIHVYCNEGKHSQPHFHARINDEYEASYAMDTNVRLAGELPSHLEREVIDWAQSKRQELMRSWHEAAAGHHPAKIEVSG